MIRQRPGHGHGHVGEFTAHEPAPVSKGGAVDPAGPSEKILKLYLTRLGKMSHGDLNMTFKYLLEIIIISNYITYIWVMFK